MSLITRAQLARVAPHATQAIVSAIVDHADAVLPRYGITTALRLQHFLAHVLVESANLTRLEESLVYTSAARIQAVFKKKRFPTEASAQPFVRNPQALANKVYGGRMGNTGPNDGWLNRGQGLIQTTGHDNIARLAAELGRGFEETRTRLTSEAGMLECAAATFKLLGCPPAADKDDILATTRLVNGGTNALHERRDALALLKRAIPQLLLPAPALPSQPALSADAAAQPKATPMDIKLPGFLAALLGAIGLPFAASASPLDLAQMTALFSAASLPVATLAAQTDVTNLVTGSVDIVQDGALGLIGTSLAVLTPFVARYLGHQMAVLLMAQIEQLCDRALSYGVELARQRIAEHGPFLVDPGTYIASMAVGFANTNAPRLVKKAKEIERKLIARLDSHLGVQTLRAENAAALKAAGAPLDIRPAAQAAPAVAIPAA